MNRPRPTPRQSKWPLSGESYIASTMLGNAKDYLQRSVDAYNEDDYKLAVIFLWAALLLFMKVRLFRVNPVLIYAGLDQVIEFDSQTAGPRYKHFDVTGDKQTVNFNEIEKRLQMLSIDSPVQRFSKPLNDLGRMRNRIEHYVDDVPRAHYVSALDSVLPFITSFVEGELGQPIRDLIANWDDLLAIDAFYKDRLARMKEHLYSREYQEATNGDDLHLHRCPRCPEGTMTDEDEQLVCRACGFTSDFAVCRRCGRSILPNDYSTLFQDAGVCDDCFDGIVDRSD